MAFTYKNGSKTETVTDKIYLYGREITGSDSADKLTLTSSSAYDTVKAKKGDDTVKGSLSNSKVYGDEGDDYINLDGTENIIVGGEGDDYIRGAGNIYGDDTLGTIKGNDTIVASGNITGGKGDDIISTDDNCHNHNTINYYNGDGDDTVIKHYDNDTIFLSGTSVTEVSASNSLTFKFDSGSIKVLDAKEHFIHVKDGNSTKSYISDGTKVIQAVGNFTNGATINDTADINFLYNNGNHVKLDSGIGNDLIYNSDKAQFTTINGGAGNDIINDHSALSMINYIPGTGNDSIEFHDTTQFYNNEPYFDDTSYYPAIDRSGRNNVTHYYGGGLLAIEGNVSSSVNSSNEVTLSIGNNKVKVKSSCFTFRELDDNGGYKYTRYWNGKTYHSFVYRDDTRTTSTVEAPEDNEVSKGNYDNSSFSEEYAKISAPKFTDEDDYIYTNFGTNKILDALNGDDYIRNWGATKSNIIGGEGNDTIYNSHYKYTAYVTIDAGIGNDYVYNDSHHVSISGREGKDTIYNHSSGDSVTINGDEGNDYIENYGSFSTISGGQGADTIYNYSSGEDVTISGDEGNDYIVSRGARNTIDGGQGDDRIYSYSTLGSASIDGGTDNDYIYNDSPRSTISGGESGNDTIINNSSIGPAIIDGGDGENYIYNNSSKSTIRAGEGNDKVYNMSTVGAAIIDVGDGTNFVYNQSSSSTITGGTGTDTIYNYSSGQ